MRDGGVDFLALLAHNDAHLLAHAAPALAAAWRGVLAVVPRAAPGAGAGGGGGGGGAAVCFAGEALRLRAVADAAAGRVLARHRQRIAGELAEAGGVEAAAAGPGSAGADAVGRAIDRVRPRAPLLSLPSGPPRAPLEPLSRSCLALRQRTGAPLGG